MPTRLDVILDQACDKMYDDFRPVSETVVESLLAKGINYTDIIPDTSP